MIRAMVETSLIDWDGKLTTVLFFDRCNFLCPFCQNWELVLHPDRFPVIPWDNIVSKLRSKNGWVDGVVFTGGEPLLFYDELAQHCGELKKMGLGVKIDTNGGLPERLSALIRREFVDYIAMDVKSSLDVSYLAAIGKTASDENMRLVENVGKSIELIMNSGIDYEFRTTCVPGIIDARAIANIGERISGAKRWFLQGFVADHAYKPELRSSKFNHQELSVLLSIAQQYVPDARLRGKTD